MRVMYVMEATLGGTRRYVEDCFRALQGEPIEKAMVYATHRADAGFLRLLDEMRGDGWSTFEIDMVRSVRPGDDARAIGAARRVFLEWKPTIVHLHSSKAGAVGRLAARTLRGIKTCYTPNSVAANIGRVYLLMERILSPLTDAYIAVTESERNELESYGLAPRRRIYTVSPSVRDDYFVPRDRLQARESLGIPLDAAVVVGIGRLALQKDPLGFVRVLAALSTRVPRVRGIWVGDGELRAEFERAAREAGLAATVTVAGWQEDVRPYLAASDVFLSTAAYESFGYVTAEALAMGRPAVASAIVGTVDIITEDINHMLYPRGDFEAAGAKIEQFLRDGDLAHAVAERARARIVTAFSSEMTRRALLHAYAAISERRSSAG
jgi:glycosyltransferase involved in cell wall biosynthesis